MGQIPMTAEQLVPTRSTAGPRPFVSLGSTKVYPEKVRTKEPTEQKKPTIALADALRGSGRAHWTPAQRRRYVKNRNRAMKREATS